MEQVQIELINLIVAILTAFAGIATKYLVGLLKKKGLVAQIENNKEIVRIVVNAVEQMYKHSNGDEKLDLVKIELLELMKDKKIKMSEKELDLIIEAMVKEMKDSVNKELKK